MPCITFQVPSISHFLASQAPKSVKDRQTDEKLGSIKMARPINAFFTYSNLDNFLIHHLTLMKFASKCIVFQNLSHYKDCFPTLLFSLRAAFILGKIQIQSGSLCKVVELFANSGDPDQMPHSVAFDLGLQCLPITLLVVSRL